MSKAALDKFGQVLVRNVRDEAISDWEMIVSGHTKSQRAQELRDRLSGFSDEQRQVFLSLVPEVADTVLHHLLRCLEEEDDIELAVTADGERVQSLRDVSDGLPGELYTDEGWIARFSETKP